MRSRSRQSRVGEARPTRRCRCGGLTSSAHTQDDVQISLPMGAVAAAVWVCQKDRSRTTISVAATPDGRKVWDVSPASAEEAPPVVPFETLGNSARYTVVGAGRKPIRRINGDGGSHSTASTSSASQQLNHMRRHCRTFEDPIGILHRRASDHWDCGLIEQPKKEFEAFIAGRVPTQPG